MQRPLVPNETSAASPLDERASAGRNQKIRILLVEDHPITRQGLRAVIGAQANLAICGEADTVEEEIELGNSLQSDMAVVDITLRDGNGLELIRQLKARLPSLAVLVLSMHEETGSAERALRAGAQGYLTKADAGTN